MECIPSSTGFEIKSALSLFGKGHIWLPYITLQQIDIITHEDTLGFVVGSSNSIFTQHTSCKFDVIVNSDAGTIEILDPKLEAALMLPAADKLFIEEITRSVVATYISEDFEYAGSDDDIRKRLIRIFNGCLDSPDIFSR